MLQTLFEGGDLSEPPFVLGFEEALFGVLGHLVDAAELRWIHAQEPAACAGVLVHAQRGGRGAQAAAGGCSDRAACLLSLLRVASPRHAPE